MWHDITVTSGRGGGVMWKRVSGTRHVSTRSGKVRCCACLPSANQAASYPPSPLLEPRSSSPTILHYTPTSLGQRVITLADPATRRTGNCHATQLYARQVMTDSRETSLGSAKTGKASRQNLQQTDASANVPHLHLRLETARN